MTQFNGITEGHSTDRSTLTVGDLDIMVGVEVAELDGFGREVPGFNGGHVVGSDIIGQVVAFGVASDVVVEDVEIVERHNARALDLATGSAS